MKEETGETYTSGNWAKMLVASDAKVGKTSWMLASTLGVFPGQQHGAIVDAPANLHVITFDEAALRGARDFLIKTCRAPKDVLNFRVYNMEDDFKKITISPTAYDRDFYNAVVATTERIKSRCRGQGTPVVMVSSLTSLAEGICRGTLGPAGIKKGAGGDQAKWPDFALQMTELRNHIQGVNAHVLWEAHIYYVPLRENQTERDETLQIPGRTGVNFPANVGYVARLRRSFGQKVPGTKVEPMFLDTRSSFTFAAGGRGFSENLQPQETDLTEVFQKLGLQVGGWKAERRVKPPKSNGISPQPRE